MEIDFFVLTVLQNRFTEIWSHTRPQLAHVDSDSDIQKTAYEFLTRKLCTLIRIEDFRTYMFESSLYNASM